MYGCSFMRFLDASRAAGLLWTSGQLGGIRTHDPSRGEAADLRLRPRGHWDLHGRALCSFIGNFQATKESSSRFKQPTRTKSFNDARFYIAYIRSTRHASSPSLYWRLFLCSLLSGFFSGRSGKPFSKYLLRLRKERPSGTEYGDLGRSVG